MIKLSDKAKVILQAVAAGKTVQCCINGKWYDSSLSIIANFIEIGEEDDLRIKSEIRNINGVEFAAPLENPRGGYGFCTPQLDSLKQYLWAESEDRDTAFAAIIDALEGSTK